MRPIPEQVVKAVNSIEAKAEAQGAFLEPSQIYVVPPGLTDPSLILMVELFGRTGWFPNLLLMKRVEGEYQIYDIADGEKIKLQARGRRKVQVLCPNPSNGAPEGITSG